MQIRLPWSYKTLTQRASLNKPLQALSSFCNRRRPCMGHCLPHKTPLIITSTAEKIKCGLGIFAIVPACNPNPLPISAIRPVGADSGYNVNGV